MDIKRKIFFILLFISVSFGCGYARQQLEITPPEILSGQAEHIQKEGLANFYKVSDILYRAEQPKTKGFKSLQEMGIRTVVNLREHHSDEKKMKGLGMQYVHIPVKTGKLNDKDVEQFLNVMADPDNYPVLVHCWHGADRTGTMVAVYRMVFDDYSREEALAEMTGKTFGFHSVWKNLPEYIKNFDIEKWKGHAEDIKSGTK